MRTPSKGKFMSNEVEVKVKRTQLADFAYNCKETARYSFLYQNEKKGIIDYSNYDIREIKVTTSCMIVFLMLCLMGSSFFWGFLEGQFWARLLVLLFISFSVVTIVNIMDSSLLSHKVQLAKYAVGKGPLPVWCDAKKGDKLKNRYTLLEDITNEIDNIYAIIDKNNATDSESIEIIDANINALSESKNRLKELVVAVNRTETGIFW